MKKPAIILYVLLISKLTFAQSISLDECQQLARQNHPLLKQAGVIEELYNLRTKSVNASNLPQIDLSGRASYQSDVTSLSIPVPGFKSPEFSKDQYKIMLDIKQKLYDFGTTKNRKQAELVDKCVSQQQNEVDVYKIQETVNSLYFNALSIQENIRILTLKKQSLSERIAIVRSAVKNGMSLPNELDNLVAENIQTDQQQVDLSMSKQTTITLLSIITGKDLAESTVLIMPTPRNILRDSILNRPEEKLFSLQKAKLVQNEKTLKSSHLPYLYAFGQEGYGRPGLNMLNNDFDNWYMFGVGLSWNIWDGNKNKNDRAALRLQQKNIDIQQENFERSIKLSLIQEENDIKKLEIILIADNELVSIKEKIAKRSASALDNGSITSADYIRDLNSALQAKVTERIHQLQLVQAKVNHQTILGN